MPRDWRSDLIKRVFSTSADAHDLEIRHVTDSAATGLVQTVVAIDVAVDQLNSGGEANRLSIGLAEFKNVCENLRLEEILQDRFVLNVVSVVKDALELNGHVCFSFLFLLAMVVVGR